eukprot:4468606-Ditylum_brightwellii.AAC.1
MASVMDWRIKGSMDCNSRVVMGGRKTKPSFVLTVLAVSVDDGGCSCSCSDDDSCNNGGEKATSSYATAS